MATPYQNRLAGPKIRVLDIDPDVVEAPIRGVLREIPLDGSQSYVAISYVWGEDKPSTPVHFSNGTLLVMKNCYTALRRLRDQSEKRTLWIDYICINQQDVEERNHQVAMMWDIYRNARHVYIWLGERTDHSDYALAWCVDASHRGNYPFYPNEFPFYFTLLPSDVWKQAKFFFDAAINAISRIQLLAFRPLKYRADAMHDIIEHAWFTRMWTIQELAAATEPFVICGDKIVPWECVQWGIHYAQSLEKNDDIIRAWNAASVVGFLGFCLIEKQLKCKAEQSFGWFLDLQARTRQCIMDLLATAKKISSLLVVAQLCSMARKQYVRGDWHMHNVDILVFLILLCVWLLLSFFQTTLQDASEDCKREQTRKGLVGALNKTRARDATDPRDKVFALFGVLKTLGIDLDEPDYGISTNEATVSFAFTRRIIEWHQSLDILIEVSNSPPKGVPTWVPDWTKPYSRIGVSDYKAAGDSVPNFVLGDRHIETSGKVLDLVEECFHNLPIHNLPKDSAPPEPPPEWFFKTKGKQNGYSHGRPGVGDVLVLISGLRVPMLLRKAGLCYKVVGLAHVKEVMEGQAWPSNDSQLEHFKLE